MLVVASDCLKHEMKYVEAIVRMRQRVVGWKAAAGARLRADAEVGSVIGTVWMVET